MYERGRGVPQNTTEAAKWYHRAAEQGYVPGKYNLGRLYEAGEGVAQDYVAAFHWFREAARQGHAYAQTNLGFMYQIGRGVARDHAEAVRWYRKAAEQGDAYAQAALRNVYQEGPGVVQDDAEAAAPRKKTASPPSSKRVQVVRVQQWLSALGYDTGPVDGLLGSKTRAAIRAFEERAGLPVTGNVSEQLEIALQTTARFAKNAAPRRYKSTHNWAELILSPRSPSPPALKLTTTGSGFFVSLRGDLITNDHVVRGCREIRIPPSVLVGVVAQDKASDLALLRTPTGKAATAAKFRGGRGIRSGDGIVVMGYPLRGLLASEANVTSGLVSALAGPGDDRRLFQITAPVQSGNSGGPVLDMAGNAVGVVVAKLNALRFAKATGDFPQNVNFGIGAGTARQFLDAHNVPYETAPSTDHLSTADVAAKARAFTVVVECWK
jgi:hypothetical protein